MTDAVQFAWTEHAVGRRVVYYPAQEGNRVRPYSPEYWSPVERLPRQQLEAIQLERLKTLVRYVNKSSPFYARLWAEAGVTPDTVKTLDDLRKFPIVKKEDFERDQRATPPFGTAFTVPPHEQMKLWQTSGTAGAPRLWAETKEDWENGMYLYARSLYGHGIQPGWRAYFAFGYPPFIGFWLCHYAAEMMGCQVVPKGPLPTQPWLGMMKRLAGTAPAFLCATPTYAQRQIEVAGQMGIDAKALGVKIISLAGEPGACVPATKSALEQAWGAKVHDIMGATETSGPLFFTCKAQSDLVQPSDHANVDYFIMEVLNKETREPVPEGESGTLCVTALGRTGIPAVRFLLNDYVRLSWENCDCGRTLPLLRGGMSARTDDMLIIKGVNVYPSLIENLVRAVPGLDTEYLLVRQNGGVLVKIEAQPQVAAGDYPGLAKRVQQDIRTATTLTLPVEILPPGSLPRSETKSKRVE